MNLNGALSKIGVSYWIVEYFSPPWLSVPTSWETCYSSSREARPHRNKSPASRRNPAQADGQGPLSPSSAPFVGNQKGEETAHTCESAFTPIKRPAESKPCFGVDCYA
jgi:hypothetical protein